ncbi:hypothetical protein [Bradyrhizobium sp. HKCCYLS20291]|uniref:hypothetical protein n=1 Tax=Bradyrhizobium sp. HKCCYLS20291 TaxID=3420766 RepID=UPI003EB790C8
MGVMPFTVRAESANAVATLRCRSAQDALSTANAYLRLGAALVSIRTPSGEIMSADRLDALLSRERGRVPVSMPD